MKANVVLEQCEQRQIKVEERRLKGEDYRPSQSQLRRTSQMARVKYPPSDLLEISEPEEAFNEKRRAVSFLIALMWAVFLFALCLIWRKAAM